MPKHRFQTEQDMEKLTPYLRGGWKKLYPVKEETIRRVREAVKLQWVKEQEAKRNVAAGGSSAARRQWPLEDPVTLNRVAEQFLPEHEAAHPEARGTRSRIRVHVLPVFGSKESSEITAPLVREYWTRRVTSLAAQRPDKPIRTVRVTAHMEVVSLFQLLKFACRLGCLLEEHLREVKSEYKRFRSSV